MTIVSLIIVVFASLAVIFAIAHILQMRDVATAQADARAIIKALRAATSPVMTEDEQKAIGE